MNGKKWRNRCISVFVLLWCLAFHYESVRAFYLEPLIQRPLPKIKFLFPPAGWIMFYRVDNSYAYVRVVGIKDGRDIDIDPHEIFRVRTIGFDNIRRGIIGVAADRHYAPAFCRQLRKRFKEIDYFKVFYHYYPNFVDEPYEQYERLIYTCTE
jgi:hypothetical protein